jgi:hypothetical protein
VKNTRHDVDKRCVPAFKVARKMHRKVYEMPRSAVHNKGCHSFCQCPYLPFSFFPSAWAPVPIARFLAQGRVGGIAPVEYPYAQTVRTGRAVLSIACACTRRREEPGWAVGARRRRPARPLPRMVPALEPLKLRSLLRYKLRSTLRSLRTSNIVLGDHLRIVSVEQMNAILARVVAHRVLEPLVAESRWLRRICILTTLFGCPAANAWVANSASY